MASDEVSNECWSSELCGAKRRSHMGPPHKSYFHRYREMGDISINGYDRGLFYVFPEERGNFLGLCEKILYKLIIEFSWLRNSVGRVGGGRGVQRRRRRNRTQTLFHS